MTEASPPVGEYDDPRCAMELLKRTTGVKKSPFGVTSVRFSPDDGKESTPGQCVRLWVWAESDLDAVQSDIPLWCIRLWFADVIQFSLSYCLSFVKQEQKQKMTLLCVDLWYTQHVSWSLCWELKFLSNIHTLLDIPGTTDWLHSFIFTSFSSFGSDQ